MLSKLLLVFLSSIVFAGGCGKKKKPQPQIEWTGEVNEGDFTPTPEPMPEEPAIDNAQRVFYKFDSSRVDQSQLETVKSVAGLLQPGAAVTIEAHADARGTVAYNEGLTRRRAASAAKALQSEMKRLHHGGAKLNITQNAMSNNNPIGQPADSSQAALETWWLDNRVSIFRLDGDAAAAASSIDGAVSAEEPGMPPIEEGGAPEETAPTE